MRECTNVLMRIANSFLSIVRHTFQNMSNSGKAEIVVIGNKNKKMRKINVFFSPYAYYVRLNWKDFEEYRKMGFFRKLIEYRRGMILYDFICFIPVVEKFDSELPIIKNICLKHGGVFCYHPFEDLIGKRNKTIQAVKIVSKRDNEFDMIFEKGQFNKKGKYYTKENEPWVKQVSYRIYGPTFSLWEEIHYSDSTIESNYYFLIASRKYPEDARFSFGDMLD